MASDERRLINKLAQSTKSLEETIPSAQGLFPTFTDYENTNKISVQVFGTIKSGKSTLMNSLMGADLLPRGSGVKTFCPVHVIHGEKSGFRVNLKTEEQIQAQLRRDLNLCNCPVKLPKDLFKASPTTLISVAKNVAAYLEISTPNKWDANRILREAFARIDKSLRGLMELDAMRLSTEQHENGVASDLSHLSEWLNSPNLASLMARIEIEKLADAATPVGIEEIELIDCQGSDSLNPLDFADIFRIAPYSDHIVYVVNSKIGIRQADMDLLAHIQNNALIDRLLLVHNIDAFQPINDNQLEELNKDLSEPLTDIADGIPLVTVSALDILANQTELVEKKSIEQLWENAGQKALLNKLRQQFLDLIQFLKSANSIRENKHHLPALVNRARSVAKDLLQRDQDVLGLRDLDIKESEALDALSHQFRGEAKALKEHLAALVDSLFAQSGPLGQRFHKHVNQALKRKDLNPQVPPHLPEDFSQLAESGQTAFNRQWLAFGDALLQETLQPALAAANAALAQVSDKIQRVLDTMTRELRSGHSYARNQIQWSASERQIDAELDRQNIPAIVEPIAISGHWLLGARLRYYIAYAWYRLLHKDEIHRQAKMMGLRKRTWIRAVRHLRRQATKDAPLSLASSREKFKYQFLYTIADDRLKQLHTDVNQQVVEFFCRLRQRSDDFLLDVSQRNHLETYLTHLESLRTEVDAKH